VSYTFGSHGVAFGGFHGVALGVGRDHLPGRPENPTRLRLLGRLVGHQGGARSGRRGRNRRARGHQLEAVAPSAGVAPSAPGPARWALPQGGARRALSRESAELAGPTAAAAGISPLLQNTRHGDARRRRPERRLRASAPR
jgi:hypothetical protein